MINMKKWIVPVVLCASIAFSSAGLLHGKPDNDGPSAQHTAQLTASERQYRLGESFTVPPYKFDTGAGEAEATAILISPTGKATVASTVILDTAGKWTVRYTASAGGKVYTHETAFTVLNDAYSVGNSLSSAEYGKYTKYECDSEGLQVKLAMNDALTFGKTIDLSKLKSTDTLVSGFVTPATRGVADFGRIVFTLTDAEEPSVYMQIMGSRYKISNERGLGTTYFAANGNGQYPAGIEKGNVHKADGLGTPASHSFVAQVNKDGWAGPAVDRAPDKAQFRLSLDMKELTAYVNGEKIIDFDDAEYFDELWFGFPSNKVRLSVSGDLYNSATANFCLTNVFGIDLTEEFLQDEDAPEIRVDVSDKDNMPEARVGGSYPIPSAAAYDEISGECKTDVKVYYNVLSAYPIAVPIVNGRFATANIGDYGIVYTAADAMGNTAREVLSVHAGKPIDELTVTCPDNPSAVLGHKAEVSAPEISGGSGDATWTATATIGGVTVDATNGFYPEKAGDYTVEYKATDFIGTEKTASCTLKVTAPSAPILPENITLPAVMIAESAYTLPAVYARDYTSGTLEEKLCDAEISDSEGNILASVKSGSAYKPTKTESGKIFVKYKCGSAESETYAVPVIMPWGENNVLESSAYFYGEGFTAEVLDNTGVTVAASGDEDFAWTFANAQTAENATVALKSIAGKTDCEAIEVYFTDAADATRSIKLTLEKATSGTRVTAGNRTVELRKSFASSSSVTFSVRYASKRLWIDTTALDVPTDIEGKPFDGFESDKVWISVRAVGVTHRTAYVVESVNGCTFSTFKYDIDAPKITVLGDFGGTYAAGDTYTISPATAGDVYCPNVSLAMTVLDPDGETVKDVNGVPLSNVSAAQKYDIALTKLGQYRINYSASEVEWKNRMGRPNVGTSMFTVNVIDSAAPELKFDGEFAKTAQVGDVLIIPDFEAKDDVTEAEKIIVMKYVLNPDGKLITLTGNSIKCEYAGEYEFRIIVRDEAGNSRMYKHSVQVG